MKDAKSLVLDVLAAIPDRKEVAPLSSAKRVDLARLGGKGLHSIGQSGADACRVPNPDHQRDRHKGGPDESRDPR
jgi:hypothetical protein